MTSAEIGSLVVATLSFLVAGIAAWKTYDLGHRQLRLGSRHEFQKLLLEANKELVRDPELWGVYDDHPMAQVMRDDSAHKAKLEAFAYMMLNIFHIVIVFIADSPEGRANDPHRAFLNAYKGTMGDFICNSSLARELLSRPDAELIYDQGFLKLMRSLTRA
jgi:hypothetical protein